MAYTLWSFGMIPSTEDSHWAESSKWDNKQKTNRKESNNFNFILRFSNDRFNFYKPYFT